MKGRRPSAHVVPIVGMIATAAMLIPSCTDATDAYCQRLAANAGLKALGTAMENGDMGAANRAAEDFTDLADDAPPDIRADMRELATGVTGIVELLEQQNKEASVSEDVKGTDTETEQLRSRLNERFDDLDRRSLRVETWASTNCGLNLS